MRAGKENFQVSIEPEAIEIVRYPFTTHNQGRILTAGEISDIVSGWAPPCVHTHEGEFVFVPAAELTRLIAFAAENDLPFKNRVDVWSMILDPFLDTPLDEDYIEKSRAVLEENNVRQAEVEAMRKLVGTRMMLLTHLTWEWVYYGLFDVLDQMSTLTFITGWTFERFYDHAMMLANRGEATPSSPEEMQQFFSPDPDSF